MYHSPFQSFLIRSLIFDLLAITEECYL